MLPDGVPLKMLFPSLTHLLVCKGTTAPERPETNLEGWVVEPDLVHGLGGFGGLEIEPNTSESCLCPTCAKKHATLFLLLTIK